MANNRTLTSANSIITLTVEGLYDTGVRIQGFTADDITGTDPVNPVQLSMGLDGRLSAGYVPTMTVQNITLQGDSASNEIFESVMSREDQRREKFVWNGVLLIPATRRRYTMIRGFLSTMPRTPDLRNTVQPRRYAITWQSVTPAPYGF